MSRCPSPQQWGFLRCNKPSFNFLNLFTSTLCVSQVVTHCLPAFAPCYFMLQWVTLNPSASLPTTFYRCNLVLYYNILVLSVYFLLTKLSQIQILVLPWPHLASAPSGSARLMCACGPSSESRWADTSCCLSWAACWARTTGVKRSSALLSFVAAWRKRWHWSL